MFSELRNYRIVPAIMDHDQICGYTKTTEENANLFVIVDQDNKVYDWFSTREPAERWIKNYSLHNNCVFNKVAA